MPSFGSGLSSQLMVGAESPVGTGVTPTATYEFLNETLTFAPTDLDGMGLKSGQAYKRAARRSRSRVSATGDFTMEFADQGHMGLLVKHCIGSTITTPTVIATTAYKQVHTPGSHSGLGLTVQVGEVQPGTTVTPLTYTGCKIPQWQFSCNDNQIAQLKCTIDGWNMTTATALASASYAASAGVFSFADASTVTLGGTASTTAGFTSIASGVTVATVLNGVTITGSTPMKVDRYGLGNAGTKKEQIENAIPTITGSFTGEFTNSSEFLAPWLANTGTPLQIDFSHGNAGSSNPYRLSFLFPQVKFNLVDPNTSGPDITAQQITFEALDDGSGTNPVMQIYIVSTDTTL